MLLRLRVRPLSVAQCSTVISNLLIVKLMESDSVCTVKVNIQENTVILTALVVCAFNCCHCQRLYVDKSIKDLCSPGVTCSD